MIAVLSVHADLVVTVLRDVAHPGHRLIPTLLDNLEVAHLDAGNGEVRNFELDLDGNAQVLVSLLVHNTREAEGGTHMELFAARELLDDPDHGRFVGNVLNDTHVGLEDRRGDIDGHGNDDLDVVRNGLLLELRAGFDHVLNLARREIFDLRAHLDQRLDLRVHTVRHELKLAIRRNERDQAFRAELVKSHALMELDIFHFDELVAALLSGHIEELLVI